MKISNPLTTIAVFAGAAEIFATYALINLPSEIQDKFVYFVMAFPTLIVILFFIILVLKNRVLYAPSDFHNEEHFLIVNNSEDNLEEILDSRIQITLNKLNEFNKPVRKEEIDELKSSFTSSVITAINEDKILAYLKSHPTGVFSSRGLGHILTMSCSSAKIALQKLEQRKLVERGIEKDSGITLWQIKQ